MYLNSFPPSGKNFYTHFYFYTHLILFPKVENIVLLHFFELKQKI